MRKEVIAPATGWIVAGAVCIVTWRVESAHPMNLLELGIFAAIVGIGLFAFNKKIGELYDKYKSAAPKNKSA